MVEEPYPAEGYPPKEEEPAYPEYWGELINVMNRFKGRGYLNGSPTQTTSLPTGDALFYPKLLQHFWELITPQLKLKTILQDFYIRVGATATFPKAQDEKGMGVIGRSADGNPILFDFTKYGTVTMTPYRSSMRIRLGREILEDEIFSIVDDQFKRAANRVALSIEGDIAVAFKEASKKSLDWLPYRYPHLDNVIKNLGYVDKYNVLMNDKKYSYGAKMSGITTLRSPMINPKVAYAVQTAFDGCYAPIGYFVTKRPFSVDVWPQPQFDSLDVIISTRYAPIITYPEAITRCRV